MSRTMFVSITLALLFGGIGSAALGDPPTPTSEGVLVDVTLRDGANDILQGDAVPGPTTYAGNEVNAWITNFFEDDDPDTETRGDFFRFHPMPKREIHLSHPDIDGGSPVTCASKTWGPTRVNFRSHSTPQWFEAIHDQGSAFGTAEIVCQRDEQGRDLLLVRYPGTEQNQGVGECVQATLVRPVDSPDRLKITFTAESFCPATIVELTRDKDEFTETQLASITSAPFEITAVAKPPTKGKGPNEQSRTSLELLEVDTFDMGSGLARHASRDGVLLAGAFSDAGLNDKDAGLRIYQIGENDLLDLTATVKCVGRQNVPALWGDTALQAVDLYTPEPGCDEWAGKEGVRIIDIEELDDPKTLGFVEIPNGAHQMTVVSDTGLVYVGTEPSHSNFQSGGGHPILDINDPKKPELTILDMGLFDDPNHPNMESSSLQPPTSSWCHDIGIDLDRDLAFCAAFDETQIWDISDPRKPIILAVITNPTMFFHHSTVASHDGNILILQDEVGAGFAGEVGCPGAQLPVGALWFYDISVPTKPKLLSYWAPAEGMPGTHNCTSHFFDVFEDRRWLAVSWFDQGLFIVDFTDPRQPQQIAHHRPENASMWDVRIHGGYLYATSMAPFDERFGVDQSRVDGGGVYVYDVVGYDGNGLR